MVAMNFVYSEQGEKDLKDKWSWRKEINRRRCTREGCPTRLYIVQRDKGLWIVDKFIEEHNHIVTTPSKISKLRSHNKLSSVAKELVDTLSVCGVGPFRVLALVHSESGYESVAP